MTYLGIGFLRIIEEDDGEETNIVDWKWCLGHKVGAGRDLGTYISKYQPLERWTPMMKVRGSDIVDEITGNYLHISDLVFPKNLCMKLVKRR